MVVFCYYGGWIWYYGEWVLLWWWIRKFVSICDFLIYFVYGDFCVGVFW